MTIKTNLATLLDQVPTSLSTVLLRVAADRTTEPIDGVVHSLKSLETA
jgi:hypothetical protein